MKTYFAFRIEGEPVVLVRNEENQFRLLSAARSLKLCNHSPTGFEWGYGGSGPAQLALAILLDATNNPRLAQAHYQAFKWHFVAQTPKDGFTMGELAIRAWLCSRTQADRKK